MSSAELPLPAEEEAALRRVATLVAGGAGPEEVFAAVTDEVGRLLAVDSAGMGRFDPDGAATFVASWGKLAEVFPVGSRLTLEGQNIGALVFATGGSVRIDSYSEASGTQSALAREGGVRSSVGTPIIVEGRLWGVMGAGSSRQQPLPADTESRLASFTELLAAAIANAESRARLSRLAQEQAALRRVATLVARGVPPEELFATVVEEVGRLLPADTAGLGRYECDGTMTFVAGWGAVGDGMPVGSRWSLEGRNVSAAVAQTGRPARIDNLSDASGPLGIAAYEGGAHSSVGAPIIVEGRLWGMIGVSSGSERPLPPDTEARLASFTELVATAIADAESRAALIRLAEEQAALRRVATLVAGVTRPEEVFAAVTDEAARLLAVEYGHMGRYDPERRTITFVATWGKAGERLPLGSSWRLGRKNLSTIVLETGRPARIDSYADASGPLGAVARETGLRSAVGAPIIVEGRVWGVMSVSSLLEHALPPDTEARLAAFTELVATAIANAESRAALAASRARIVAAGDESRRQIERDLHDGAQQRLVHAVIVLKLALRALASGDAKAGELVAEALRHAEQANSELRELAHGILPAALSRGGLRAGVEALVSRVSLPVTMDVSVERLAAGVESTAYFVVSEALTNVVKHARARSAEVSARVEGGRLRVEICDDGVGGARGGDGTGLGGLADRVAALEGRLLTDSPPGGGTRICALLPLTIEA